MFQYVKTPRNISQYSLMKGVTDFSNLRQFDVFETSYSFLVVCSTPRFISLNTDTRIQALEAEFVHILEGEFKGISGIPDITADAQTITNGANELQLISNVTMDTSIQVSMSYYERSGSPLTKYAEYYLTGIKDPYSKAKTYHGMIGAANNPITDPGPDYETFTFLYYVTDNTCRKLEKAYLLTNAQLITAPMSQVYNSQRGDITFPEIELTFNCFPIISDKVNQYAAQMLEYQLSTTNTDKLVLDHDDFTYTAYGSNVTGGHSLVASKIESGAKAAASKYADSLVTTTK